ncbi:peptidoglycan DD-metalloendopeptidase family protein [Streptomyces sp. CC224B]|uniref:aggregation-promoting factor C-terminal-like domain-containing protein n=1 Tax=Streptomyces sp. CC224B TaxID=3044571 RepID=UPI0024A98F79|nr:peptidoglycan DD-metalloendopeptidase family protein [Streptomyces sp. CC224B]
MAISVGSVEIDVIPNARGVHGRLRAALVPPASQIGDEVGRIIGRQIATHITPAVRDGIQNGARAARPAATRQGSDTGGAFARSLRARLEAAFRSMPRLDVRLSDTGVDADLARLRARLEALSGKTIGVDIDAQAARAEAADIEERLRRIGAAHPNVAVRADTAAAIAQLRLLREQMDELSADPARIRVETDGTFGQRLRAQVQAAEASLPNINIGADTSPAEVELARLRARLTALRDVRIGVDMDAATAQAEISAIEARLQALAAQDADVAVRVDAAAAAAQLAAVQAMVNRLDSDDVRIRVDTSGAMSAIFQLTVALGSVAAIPAIPVLAAGMGAIASAGVAAAAGVGALGAVAIPAFMGIARAAQAQKAAQDAATTAQIKGGQAAAQSAARASQLAGAQQALAAAHRNAARQIQQAEQAVADAKRSAAEATRNAAQQIRQAEQDVAAAVQQAAERQRGAAQQVKDAKQSLANAVQQAADRQQAANERVVAAEQSLADAQRTARQAQQDLTQARREASMELEDLGNHLASAQLSQRDAVLGVQEAEQRLRAVRAAGSKASALQQAQAQLAYDQAVQRLREQQLATKRIADEKKKADKAGVDGSDRVKSAQDRLAQAQRQVREQTADLAKAQQAAARQQHENALEIASAQERVADSQRSAARVQKDSADAIAAAQAKVVEAQRDARRVQEDGARSVGRAQESLAHTHTTAAESIASAQRQVASASQQAAGGMDQAAVAQAKYQDELSKLSPSARDTFDAFTELRSAFTKWSESLQPAVMPIFTRALVGLKNALPGLSPFARAAAGAIGELQDRASRGFNKPWWKGFKADLSGAVRPAIIGLGVAFGNVFKGMAGVVQAFLPHMDSISTRMQAVTARFASWGTGLKGSPAFERFLAYAAENGPLVARTIGDISSAFYQVARALEPLSGPILQVLGALARGLASVAETLPWLIQGLYLLYIGTRLWTLSLIALRLVMAAHPLTLIVIAVVALVAAVVYAYKHFGWFREAVQAAWRGIQAAALWAWTNILKPTFDAIVGALRTVGRWASWLWHNAIKPAFDGIVLAARILVALIAVVLVAPLLLAFRGIAATGKWLYERVLAPAFRGIGSAADSLWRNVIEPVGAGIAAAFRFVARVGKWLYETILRPTFQDIGAAAGALHRAVIKPVADRIAEAFRVVARVGKWLWREVLAPAFRGIGGAARSLYEKTIRPVFGHIAGRASWLWNKGLKPAFDKIKEGVRLVAQAFERAKKWIGSAWGKLKSITKGPVNFVIEWVYGKGIRPVWNAVAKIVSLDELPKAPKLLAAGGTVGNGFDPARPMVTNRPTAIVGEGNRCIAHGTEIQTAAGPRPIEDIQAGEQVLTRYGYRLVKWSGLTRPDAEVLRLVTASGDGVVCTPDHLVWTARGSKSGDRSGDCLGRRAVRGGGLLPDHQDALRHTGSVDAFEHDGSRHGGAVSAHRGLKSSLGTHGSRAWPEADVRRGRVRAEECQAADNRLPALAGGTPHSEGAGTAGIDRGAGRRRGVPEALLQARTPVDAGERVHESARHSGVPSVQEGRWPRVDAPEAGEQPGVPRAGEGEGPRISAPEACWREARDLIPGDWVWVLTDGGLCAMRVAAVTPAERTDTFDLTVDRDHEFVAGGILVHNSYPEYVIPTDPKYRGRARSLWEAAGTKLMADGGILGGAWDWTKGAFGKVAGWAKTGWDLMTNPSKVWDKLVRPIKDRVAEKLSGPGLWAKAIRRVPGQWFGKLKTKLVDAVNSMLGGGADGALGGAWLKPVDARFGTRFGARGSMWASGRHTGLDFPAAIGTAVKAVADGTIAKTADGGPYGKHIVINHGSGLQSLYAHLSAILMRQGRGVAAGTQIGRVGRTGNVTGPHLHLEARVNGRSVDPMPFLTGGGKGFKATAVGAAQRYAKAILGRYGWGPEQFGPLKKLWHGESGWRWNARNPSSGAYGIPQALPATKMRSAGADWRTNAATQIRWGLGYIKGRPDYGSPARAYAKWLARSPHWYDQGGMLQPGLNLAYNGTGRPEAVLTGSQWNILTRAASGSDLGDLHVSVYVGDREITDIARAEVHRSNGELVTMLRGGRG